MIRDSLSLDHLFLTFSRKEIAELRVLSKVVSNCTYLNVQSGRDKWRGVYLRSNMGSYFEMLEGGDSESLGIACSAWRPQYVDVLKLRNELPRLHWKVGRRKWALTNKTWFEWLSLRAPREIKLAEPGCFAWIMKYHQVHDELHSAPRIQASVDRFQRVVIRLGAEHIPSLRYHTQWFPKKCQFGKKSAFIQLPDRDGGIFSIEIDVVSGCSPARFIQLDGTLCATAKTKPAKLENFAVKISSQDIFTLVRTKN